MARPNRIRATPVTAIPAMGIPATAMATAVPPETARATTATAMAMAMAAATAAMATAMPLATTSTEAISWDEGAQPQKRVRGRTGVKRYRPHILVVTALAIVLSTGWHGALRNALTDLRFAWQSRAASGNIVVVAIDAPSIEQIGVWPWPRRLHAELLHRLEAAGARDIAFDV